ncbi:DHBP synthase RibB-like alpha/beta domain-containing protein [Haematococcus lacustris]
MSVQLRCSHCWHLCRRSQVATNQWKPRQLRYWAAATPAALMPSFSSLAVNGGQHHPIFSTECLVVDPDSPELAAIVQAGVQPHQASQDSPGGGTQPLPPLAAAPPAALSDASQPPTLAGQPLPLPRLTNTTALMPTPLSPLHAAAALLLADQVVALPTETVYGLAANALSVAAVARIYTAKQRPADNPLIVHGADMGMLRALYPPGWKLPSSYQAAVQAHWPGPLTILLPRSPQVPDIVTCGQPTMAVRMPSHPVARALIALAGVPLAAPSANSSGRPSPTTAAHVMEDLAGRIPLVLDGGPCSLGLESTVLDALRHPPVVLRPGGVTAEQLRRLPGLQGLLVYSKDLRDAALEQAPTTPGMKYRHYSPTAQVTLLDVSGWPGSLAALRVASAARMQSLLWDMAAKLAVKPPPSQPPGQLPGQLLPAMFSNQPASQPPPASQSRQASPVQVACAAVPGSPDLAPHIPVKQPEPHPCRSGADPAQGQDHEQGQEQDQLMAPQPSLTSPQLCQLASASSPPGLPISSEEGQRPGGSHQAAAVQGQRGVCRLGVLRTSLPAGLPGTLTTWLLSPAAPHPALQNTAAAGTAAAQQQQQVQQQARQQRHQQRHQQRQAQRQWGLWVVAQ